MVKSNIITPNMQQKQISIPEAVNALVVFMGQQMELNKAVRHDMGIIRRVVEPVMVAREANRVTCVEAIK